MIYNGNNEIGDLFFGSNEIGQVFYGNNEVWSKSTIISLGEGKTFDIASVYPNYSELTADNFMTSGNVSNPSASDSATYSGESMGLSANLVKTYNSSTGQLNFYLQCSGSTSSTASVIAWLVPDLAGMVNKGKAKSLGSGRTIDIKTLYPDDYQNFTIKNFLIQTANGASNGARYYEGFPWTCSGYAQLPFSYDESTGILNCGHNLIFTNDGGGYLHSQYVNATCYLFLKPHA